MNRILFFVIIFLILSCNEEKDIEPRVYVGEYLIESSNGFEIFGYQESLERLRGFEVYEGDLFIERVQTTTVEDSLNGTAVKYSPIKSLEPLSSLKMVTGNLSIYGVSNLKSLAGLENLKFAGGLLISKNDSLVSVEQVGSLVDSIHFGQLSIYSNEQLQRTLNFQKLIVSSISIRENSSLIEIMNPLHTVDSLPVSLQILANDKLENLNFLNNVKTLYSMDLRSNPNLHDISSLKELEKVESYLDIVDNNSLTEIHFPLLSQSRSLAISENKNLQVIALGNHDEETVHEVRTVRIRNNPNLKSISGFKDMRKLENLYIVDNDRLENVNGFDACGYVDVTISRNPKLWSVDLFSLPCINADDFFKVEENDALKNFCGFNSVIDVFPNFRVFEIDGNLYNPSIEDFEIGNCAP